MTLNQITTDVLIIGAGPAGTQCAMVLDNQKVNTVIINKSDMAGGLQNENPYKSAWVATSDNSSGQEFAAIMEKNIISRETLTYVQNAEVLEIVQDTIGDLFQVHAKKTNNSFVEVNTKNIVLAMGVKPRMGHLEPHPNFIFGPGHKIMDYNFDGQNVAILGGGDNAFENYYFISNMGAKAIDLYAKKIIARSDLQTYVPQEHIYIGNIIVNQSEMLVNQKQYDTICVFFGWEPNLIRNLSVAKPLQQNSKGFYAVDHLCQTSHPHIYAIGEVNNRFYPSIVQSMADGMIAGKVIAERL